MRKGLYTTAFSVLWLRCRRGEGEGLFSVAEARRRRRKGLEWKEEEEEAVYPRQRPEEEERDFQAAQGAPLPTTLYTHTHPPPPHSLPFWRKGGAWLGGRGEGAAQETRRREEMWHKESSQRGSSTNAGRIKYLSTFCENFSPPCRW